MNIHNNEFLRINKTNILVLKMSKEIQRCNSRKKSKWPMKQEKMLNLTMIREIQKQYDNIIYYWWAWQKKVNNTQCGNLGEN